MPNSDDSPLGISYWVGKKSEYEVVSKGAGGAERQSATVALTDKYKLMSLELTPCLGRWDMIQNIHSLWACGSASMQEGHVFAHCERAWSKMGDVR